MKNILLALSFIILSGCYAATSVKQDYQLADLSAFKSIENTLSLNGYSICKAGSTNHYCSKNTDTPLFKLSKNNDIVTIDMAVTHISRQDETDAELSKIEDLLLKINGLVKLCSQNKTVWGFIKDVEQKCPSS